MDDMNQLGVQTKRSKNIMVNRSSNIVEEIENYLFEQINQDNVTYKDMAKDILGIVIKWVEENREE